MQTNRCTAVIPFAAIAAALLLASASSASTRHAGAIPRLSGRFPTLFRIASQTNIVGVRVGQQAVTTWRFTPRCAAGACPTVLVRPSIIPGSTVTYSYVLEPVSATRYLGSTTPAPTYCQLSNGQQIQGAVINHQTIVLNVIRSAGGKVIAYSGTTHTVNTVTALGRAHNCAPSVQTATFKSTGR